MIYALLFLMCVVFVELVILMDMREHLKSTMILSKEALAILTSSVIEDDQKEIFMRRRSLEILKTTAIFTAKFFLIFLILYILYVLTVQFSPVSKKAFIDTMLSLRALFTMTVTALFYIWMRNAVCKRL